jgi:exodeoxyribonuclease VII small subunit
VSKAAKSTPEPIDAEVAAMGYEQAVESLESIIERIESGEIGLEASLAEYRRGVALVRHCRSILDSAEQQVRLLSLEEVEGLAAAIDEAGSRP